MVFEDRKSAGRQLAEELSEYRNNRNAIVLGLPRGGVVVAYEIAKALNLPLDIIVPRKIGAPGNPEFAIGAIAEGGEGVFDQETISSYRISQEYIEKEVEKEKKEAERRLKLYRGNRPPLNLEKKTAILVDDGIATGATMEAAIQSIKSKGVEGIIVAAPTSAKDSLERIKAGVDKVICLDAPAFFGAVGAFYKSFPQTTDEEVIELMKGASPEKK